MAINNLAHNDLKIIVVGAAGSGKTSLIESYLGDNFQSSNNRAGLTIYDKLS